MCQNAYTFIGRNRNQILVQLSDNIFSSQNASVRTLISEFRARAATHWKPFVLDACLVDKSIGNRRLKKFAACAEAEQFVEDDAAFEEQEMKLFLKEVGRDRTYPTDSEQQIQAFVHHQHAVLHGVLHAANAQAAPTTCTADTLLLAATKTSNDIWEALTDSSKTKATAKTKPTMANPSSPIPAHVQLQEPAGDAFTSQLNATQTRVLDSLRPKLEEYHMYNATSGAAADERHRKYASTIPLSTRSKGQHPAAQPTMASDVPMLADRKSVV